MCGANLGVCTLGLTKCRDGKLVCVGQTAQAQPEVCNTKDDDCNGLIDDGIPGLGNACVCGQDSSKTLMTGECRPGKLTCEGREPLDCQGCIGPRPEICDGKDNDCDGALDNQAPCASDRVCQNGECQIVCRNGEFPCPLSYVCNRTVKPALCESTKCTGVLCQAGMRCAEDTGLCYDPCEGVPCPAPQMCRDGICQTCYVLGCPPGETCQDSQCKPNPCAAKRCEAGTYCDEQGQCVAVCNGRCESGQRCVRGACKTDLCHKLDCPSGQVCDPGMGKCVTNLCHVSARTCLRQRCSPFTGQCVDDPCLLVSCPGPCPMCQVTVDGIAQCGTDSKCDTAMITIRGGGCAVAPRGGAQAQALLTLAFLAGVVLRGRARCSRRIRRTN
jgi:hypothetical protein